MTRVTLIDAPLIHAGKALSTAAGTLAAVAAAALISMPAAADSPAAPPAGTTAPRSNDETKLPESDANGEWVMVGAISKGEQRDEADDARDAPASLPSMDDDGR